MRRAVTVALAWLSLAGLSGLVYLAFIDPRQTVLVAACMVAGTALYLRAERRLLEEEYRKVIPTRHELGAWQADLEHDAEQIHMFSRSLQAEVEFLASGEPYAVIKDWDKP